MKKTILFFIFALILPVFASAAEIENFVDSDFDFSKVENVYVLPLFAEQATNYVDVQDRKSSYQNSHKLNLLTTQDILDTKNSNITSDINKLTSINWPQPYVKLLEQAQKKADIIIFTDIVQYSSPPAQIEQINIILPGGALAAAESRQDNTTVQATAVPVFLPEGDFPALRFYAVSANDLNVPVLSTYYKMDTDGQNNDVLDNPYNTGLSIFLSQLEAAVKTKSLDKN